MAKTAIATSRIERGMFARRVARLLGEVRDGLDSRVRDHRDRDREQEVAPASARRPQCTFSGRMLGLKTSTKPEQDEEDLGREVDHGEQRC